MVKQPQGLISVLLDSSNEFGDRDDAALDLSLYDEPEAEAALAQIATDATNDEDLADTCGESLAEIWLRKGCVDREVFARLSPASKRVVILMLEASRPDLMP